MPAKRGRTLSTFGQAFIGGISGGTGATPPVVVTGGPPTGARMAMFEPFRVEYVPPLSDDEALLAAIAYWTLNDD